MTELLDFMKTFTPISFGLMAGIYFIFSNTIMKSLSNIREEQAATTMSQINLIILNPVFLLLFFGSGISAFFVIVTFVTNDISLNMLLGSMIFLIGSTLITLVINVPLNKKLDVVVYSGHNAIEFWDFYLRKWTRWNHVRTFCAIVGFVLFLL